MAHPKQLLQKVKEGLHHGRRLHVQVVQFAVLAVEVVAHRRHFHAVSLVEEAVRLEQLPGLSGGRPGGPAFDDPHKQNNLGDLEIWRGFIYWKIQNTLKIPKGLGASASQMEDNCFSSLDYPLWCTTSKWVWFSIHFQPKGVRYYLSHGTFSQGKGAQIKIWLC
jgi:hypothetical protein